MDGMCEIDAGHSLWSVTPHSCCWVAGAGLCSDAKLHKDGFELKWQILHGRGAEVLS